MHRPYTVALIVPTGIGAAMGGYAGDALPIARAVAASCDRLITHPNVMNGAQLYWSMPNAFYVEGYALDKFAAGTWGLQPVRRNRIGIVFDRSISDELRVRHLQAADAARATLGLDITDYVVTDMPLGVELRTASSGASWGTIEQPDSLLRAVDKLINVAGAEAIAVIARFPDDPGATILHDYRHGTGVDPLAGAEAVISHLVVRTFRVPCAHAPALSPLPIDPEISPRSAAEELGYTFLSCVLVGLSRAPQFVTTGGRGDGGTGRIWNDQVDAVIVPESACGGSGLISFARSPRTKVITVAENHTRMLVPPKTLGIKAIAVRSYLEAIGVITVDRAGMSLDSFYPQIDRLKECG
ncbi:DUF3326 domain-containing protein [Chamaesiphon sp. VAR_48_metabat_135_sub]|uniref:DUF3326 domain-containing protein n=1 Tax=Chamaesiphon sp. VAR_48_metabat_135_sub TaxID=2964699 RepID=UPI00286CA1E0|nr:DUF3326 domain-containing protein [Chamaesiphon sp. VAR_48_metabat_135_sub]